MREHAIIAVTSRGKAELLPAQPPAEPLGPDEVYGRTLFSLVSAGTELNYNYLGASFPTHPGYAAVFRIEAVGSGVKDLEVGSIAFCLGPHRSFQRTERRLAVPVPDGLDPAQATFGRLMCVTMSALTTTGARPPQVVLVTGLGPVGLLGALIFASCGYRVVACDPVETRQAAARQAGLADVRSAIPLDDPAVAGRAALVIECSGHEQAALDGCRAVRKGGEVVLVGVPWLRRTDGTAHELLHAVFHHYAVLRSGWEWEVPLHETDFVPNSIYGNIAGAMKWLVEGRVRVDGLYALVEPAECDRVYRQLLEQSLPKLAAVFRW